MHFAFENRDAGSLYACTDSEDCPNNGHRAVIRSDIKILRRYNGEEQFARPFATVALAMMVYTVINANTGDLRFHLYDPCLAFLVQGIAVRLGKRMPEAPANLGGEDLVKHCRNPEIMGGTPVFSGTRVPVQTLLDYLEAGDSIDEFIEGFPALTREQVIAFLEQAKDQLVESVS